VPGLGVIILHHIFSIMLSYSPLMMLPQFGSTSYNVPKVPYTMYNFWMD